MLEYKKAQIGETMTWVVATLTIIVILIISIYITSALAITKKTIKYKEYDRENDLLLEKSLFAYFLLEESQRDALYDKLKDIEFHDDLDDKLEEIGGNLT